MATTIIIGETIRPATPECAHADTCAWFEKKGSASGCCANRDDNICPRRLADVFLCHQNRRIHE